MLALGIILDKSKNTFDLKKTDTDKTKTMMEK